MEPQSPTPQSQPPADPSDPLSPPPGGWGTLTGVTPGQPVAPPPGFGQPQQPPDAAWNQQPGAPQPQQNPPPGWGQQSGAPQPQQGPPPGWGQQAQSGQPQQAPPPGWGQQPQQGPPPGWGQQPGGPQPQQGPPPGWGQQPQQGQPQQGPAGWVQQQQQPLQGWAPPQQGWVQPGMVATQGPVTPLAKIGALVLILFGLFWAAIWGIVAVGGAAATSGGLVQIPGAGSIDLSAVANAILIFGLVMAIIAVLEIVIGVFSWRGGGAARLFGVIYALLFGGVSLLIGVSARGETVPGSSSGAIFFLIFAVGYLYTAAVFVFAFRKSR